MAESKSKIAILIYYQVREHVSSCKLTFAFCIKALCLEVQCTMESEESELHKGLATIQ